MNAIQPITPSQFPSPTDDLKQKRQPDIAESVLAYDSSFPVSDDQPDEDQSTQDLIHFMKAAIFRGFNDLGEPVEYHTVRQFITEISDQLNQLQTWAPRFRGFPALSVRPTTTNEKNFLIDMQVFDLHWRACSKNKPRRPINDFPNLFDGKDFNFELAERFAARTLPFEMKLMDARLTPSMTREHAVLQSPKLRDSWRVLQKGRIRGTEIDQWGIPQIEAMLHEATQARPHLQKHIPGWVDSWIAYRMVGQKPKQMANLVALMRGTEAPDPSALSRKLETVLRYQAEARKKHL